MHLDAIHAQLVELARARPDLCTFRSRCAPAEIAGFEAHHGVELPTEYRRFLLDVGNGGSVNGATLFPLGMTWSFETNDFGPWFEVGSLSQQFCADAFNDDEEDDAWMEPCPGAFPVAYLGCTIWEWLVITGPDRGEIWEREHPSFVPAPNPLLRALSFSEWVFVEAAKGAKRKDWIDHLRHT